MGALTYFGKPVTCPVCNNTFQREILRQGGGRLNAADLQTDLRRTYKPSPKYGKVNPLNYNIVICPECYYATLPEDFLMIKEDLRKDLATKKSRRQKWVKNAFGFQDYTKERSTKSGAASYFMALSVYSSFPKDWSPTFKKSICAIRCSWLLEDLHGEEPAGGWDVMWAAMRYTAWQLYDQAIYPAGGKNEPIDKISSMGPDLDVNYSWDGALYMLAYLGWEQSDTLNDAMRLEALHKYRTTLSKVFGFGKVSKNKPSTLVNTAKDLHGSLSASIQELETKLGVGKPPPPKI